MLENDQRGSRARVTCRRGQSSARFFRTPHSSPFSLRTLVSGLLLERDCSPFPQAQPTRVFIPRHGSSYRSRWAQDRGAVTLLCAVTLSPMTPLLKQTRGYHPTPGSVPRYPPGQPAPDLLPRRLLKVTAPQGVFSSRLPCNTRVGYFTRALHGSKRGFPFPPEQAARSVGGTGGITPLPFL